MPRHTLVDFFDDLAQAPGEFLVYDDGYRSRGFTYREVASAARQFAARLDAAGFVKGDAVVVWGENRPEWIVALWGCVLRGVVAVPIDFRVSADFLERVRAIVRARLVLVGDEVPALEADAGAAVWRLRELLHAEAMAPAVEPSPVALGPDDVAEIIFTSGATAEPKGVVITHRNILANIVPIEREVAKYRRFGKPFYPIRFLNLLPLSHMFGQAMATFVPPMLPGTVIFMRGYNPQAILHQVRSRRISVLVSVPKILDVVRDHLERAFPATAQATGRGHWLVRWWRHRDVHRAFGWKFWAFVVGAAPLEPALEEFMGRLGFMVIQGYGLTETAPIVTLNHPFSAKKGTVGKPIAGVDIRIAADGEILVRGDNVTRGYFNAPAATAEAMEDGWLHTGDIGGLDENGRLTIRGRKKEMIVTPEGLNVFPEDVERALASLAGVREAAAVGRTLDGDERVHAVLVVERGVDPEAVVASANRVLLDHQKIRSFSVWPGPQLPRTEGTRKLRRREIRTWVEGTAAAGAPSPARGEATLDAILARFGHGERTFDDATTIEALGLSSLERVELLMALEERFDITLDEGAFAAAPTVGDLRALVDSGRPQALAGSAVSEAPEPSDLPRWSRSGVARLVRRLSLPTWILPIGRIFVWLRVEGRERLDGLEGPVVFAANHQSHLDGPAVLMALPARWRYRVAIAMAKEFFAAHFAPHRYGRADRIRSGLLYHLAALFFNAFPLPQREAGTRETLRYIGELAGAGESILIFPEGKRTEHGEIEAFRPGVGMIAARLDLPVVPIRLEGLDRILHRTWRMARPGRARVVFGEPLRLAGDDHAGLAKRVEDAVRAL